MPLLIPIAATSMYLVANSVQSEEFALPTQPAPVQPKRSTLKVVFLVAILIVAVVVVVFLASSSEANIPLEVNYQVGEKMVYDATISLEMQTSNVSLVAPQTGLTTDNVSTSTTITTEVLSFDGETYTLNQTTTMNLIGQTQSISLTQKVNKTGFSTFMFNSPADTTSFSTGSNSLLKSLLDKPDVKVGESVQVPIEGLKGNLTLTFGGIDGIVVPAGTYKVYKVTLYSDDLAVDNQIPQGYGGGSIQVSMSMDGEMYVEYSTGRQIKYSMQSTTSSQASGMTLSFDMTYQMTLTQHIPAVE